MNAKDECVTSTKEFKFLSSLGQIFFREMLVICIQAIRSNYYLLALRGKPSSDVCSDSNGFFFFKKNCSDSFIGPYI